MTEPTLQEMAHYVVKKTGGCWHENEIIPSSVGSMRKTCPKCGSLKYNPTFTDDAGKIALLRLMNQDFFRKINPRLRLGQETTVPIIYLFDNSGMLLKAACQFLKEKK